MTDNTLYRFKPHVMKYLNENCDKHLDEYRDPNTDFDQLLKKHVCDDYKEPVNVNLIDSLELCIPEGKSPRHAELEAIKFYHALEGMSPRLATDSSLLAYINHFYLHDYGIKRWSISKNNRKAVTDIRNHWITRYGNFTSLYTRNIAGRTWWIAHTSLMISKASNNEFTAETILEMFVNTAEYYHRTMEWKLLYNYTIMAECVRTIIKAESKISIDQYREMISSVNREAGGKVFDALDQNVLRQIIENIAKEIYK